jgi:Protein of unknown function (DUF1091)
MKTLTPYYNSVINTTLNLCEFLNGTQSSIARKYFLDMFKKSLPIGFLHPCPYFGEVKLINMPMNLVPQSTQFLTGTYRSFVKFYDDKDDNIIRLTTVSEAKDIREKH